jgi:AcrR family transcriptional regulator
MKMSTVADRVSRGSRARREAARQAAREQILRAAGELLLEGGYEWVSLRRVAERIGYTPTAIYRHFAAKDALLYAVTEEAFRMFTDRLRNAAQAATTPIERLEAIGLAYLDFGLEHPAYYRMLLITRPDLLWRRSERTGSRLERFDGIRATVDAAVAGGLMRATDVLAVTNALWAQLHGTLALALSMPHLPPRQVRAFGALGLSAILRGLTSRP